MASGPDKRQEVHKNSIASEKVGRPNAKKAGNARMGSGNSRRSAGAKLQMEQAAAHARTTESGAIISSHDQNNLGNKLNSSGGGAFDIQMDQLHVVDQNQLTGDRTIGSGVKSPKEEVEPHGSRIEPLSQNATMGT